MPRIVEMSKRPTDQEKTESKGTGRTPYRDTRRAREAIDRTQSMIDKNIEAIDTAHKALDDMDANEKRRERADKAGQRGKTTDDETNDKSET